MANKKVEIKVAVKCDVKNVYVVGSTANLGAWNAAKAVKLDFCEECGCYGKGFMLPEGETVEFKVLASNDWANVEKGAYGEEVANHAVTVVKGATAEVEVVNFAK